MLTITKNENQPVRQESKYIQVEIRGLSTDEKPTTVYSQDIDNGSVFIEIDTGKIYFYDLEKEQWKEA